MLTDHVVVQGVVHVIAEADPEATLDHGADRVIVPDHVLDLGKEAGAGLEVAIRILDLDLAAVRLLKKMGMPQKKIRTNIFF